jgi:hypothetical protein
MRVHLLVCVLGLIGHRATAQSVDSKSLATTDSCLPGMIAASNNLPCRESCCKRSASLKADGSIQQAGG